MKQKWDKTKEGLNAHFLYLCYRDSNQIMIYVNFNRIKVFFLLRFILINDKGPLGTQLEIYYLSSSFWSNTFNIYVFSVVTVLGIRRIDKSSSNHSVFIVVLGTKRQPKPVSVSESVNILVYVSLL